MSKGSKRRPQQIDDKKMQENWDKIFNKEKKNKTEKQNDSNLR